MAPHFQRKVRDTGFSNRIVGLGKILDDLEMAIEDR